MNTRFSKDSLLGLDLDGCFRDFTTSHNRLYNYIADRRKSDKIIEERFEGSNYYFTDNPEYDKDISDYVWKHYQTELFLHAEIYPGSFEIIKEIKEYYPYSFFITHQFTDEAKIATHKWLEKENIIHSCIFCDGDYKWKYCDILFDDKIENLYEAEKHGKVVFCMARPWNAKFKGPRGDYNDFRKFLFEI